MLLLVSWAGMFYLTLFLCSKFSVTIPYLLPYTYESPTSDTKRHNQSLTNGDYNNSKEDVVASAKSTLVPLHKQAAAPPTYLFILPLFTISIPSYVASTRFSDFRHHGFDILFGSLMGILISYMSFRMYHLPIRRGAGWSWGPRSVSRAWGIGVGTQGYRDGTEMPTDRTKIRDMEAGNGPSNPMVANPTER